MSASRDPVLILRAVARRLQDNESWPDTVEIVTTAAMDAVPSADSAGVTLVQDHRSCRTAGATHPAAHLIDRAHNETNEGPCLTALSADQMVHVDDLSSDQRWPNWAARARETGVLSVVYCPLYAGSRQAAALCLLARRPAAFDHDSRRVAALIAAQAAVALTASERSQQLHEAIGTRDTIGMAKGILVERLKITPEGAFALLVGASQRSNIKLRDVAEMVVSTGLLPESAFRKNGSTASSHNRRTWAQRPPG